MTPNEQAAFKGAASLPTPEQIAAQPWRYPQGRIPPEETEWTGYTWQETVLFLAICLFYAAAPIAVLYWIFQ
jgi:hypothetical protein